MVIKANGTVKWAHMVITVNEMATPWAHMVIMASEKVTPVVSPKANQSPNPLMAVIKQKAN